MRSYLLILLFFFVLILLPLFLFKFGKVECFNVVGPSCSPEVSSMIYSFVGKSFFDVYAGVSDLSSLPLVSNYDVVFFPLKKRIEFRVEEKKILLGVEVPDGSFFLVGEDGSLIKKTSQPPNTALVKVESFNYRVSDKVPDDLFSSFQMVSYLYNFYNLEKGVIFSDRIEIYIKNGPILILPREKDHEVVLGRARFLLDSLLADPQRFKLDKSVTYITIDLRYKNPVLK